MIFNIKDHHDPGIQEFISLKNKSASLNNYIIAESEKVVLKLFKSNLKVSKILARNQFYDKYKDILPEESQYFRASKQTLEKIVGFNLHHGVFAKAQRPDYVQLNDLGEKVLILEELKSPENVGTIIRTATGLGFTSIIVDEKACSPYLRRCIRVSMGSIFNCKIHLSKNLTDTALKLQTLDYKILGTTSNGYDTDLKSFKSSQRLAVIFGSEGKGMSDEMKKRCDSLIGIPVSHIDSLNVACAASIILYQLS